MKVFNSPESRRKGIAILAGLAVAVAGSYLLIRTYAPFVFDATAMRDWVSGFGAGAPVVFVVLQATQVVVAPVPGQITALVGGYLFGAVWGTVYSMIGVMIGSAVAFLLAQRFGRPVVEQLLHEELVDRFDGFVEGLGLPGLALFVVIPGLPDDAICFVVGLTRLDVRRVLVVSLIGRLPGYALVVLAGDSLAGGRALVTVAILGVLLVASGLVYLFRRRIGRWLTGDEPAGRPG